MIEAPARLGKKQRTQHSIKSEHNQRRAGDAAITGHVPVSGERKGEEGRGGHGPNRKWSIYFDYMRKDNKARGRGKSP